MVKIGIKIGQALVLLITFIALMGVNVKQLCCCHPEPGTCKIQILPVEEECPCGEKEIPASNRHVFYKVSDYSRIERGLQMSVTVYSRPVVREKRTVFSELLCSLCFWSLPSFPRLLLERDFLCIYQC